MSFSEPTIKNPSTLFIEFKGDEGKLQYYDKEKKEAVTIPLPVYFIVLDELSTISGYCEKTKSGIYSNEVHRIATETLNIRTFKGGESVTGLYKDISDKVKVMGGKFCKSVYAMLIKEGEPEIVNFKFKGASFSAWLDKKIDAQKFAIGITDVEKAVKGKTEYFMPVFQAFKMTPEQKELALTLDRQLQVYLRSYKSQQIETEVKAEVKAEDIEQQILNSEFGEVPVNKEGQWQKKLYNDLSNI